ncbi:hypothetical protein ACSBR2_034010 [Camellia fascicularis]
MYETIASAKDAPDHVKHLISEAWKKLKEAKLVGSPFNPIFVEIVTNLPRVAKFMYLHRDGHGHDEVAESVKQDFGSIDILVHSLANGPEVCKPLSETSRNGYLAAISASSYSFISLLRHFLPRMNPGGASISLTYIASKRIIPGYISILSCLLNSVISPSDRLHKEQMLSIEAFLHADMVEA